VPCGTGIPNAAGDDASGPNTTCGPPSCKGLAVDCGASENCCTSPTVTGSPTAFKRDNNAIYPATVSSFRLDKFEVTVGRFRKFVDAVVLKQWSPVAGSGRHTHLNNGAGLANSTGGGNEPGWDASWSDVNLPPVKKTWDGASYLGCNTGYQTWTEDSGPNETKPINCVNWYQAAAFCIWDGGFLPSEAEWNYAAAGGDQQRNRPWSDPFDSTTIDCTYANYFGASGGTDFCVKPGTGSTSVVGSVSPRGNGRYGQADLAGNVWEWNLDWYGNYAATCNNCANTVVASGRTNRGGMFGDLEANNRSSTRNASPPTLNNFNVGLRCARTP